MLYYKTSNGQVFAYDSLADLQKYGAPDLIPLTAAEVAVLTAPAPPKVPQSVTRFQALAALHLAGHLPAVQAIMANSETPVLAKLAWDNALSFERTSPTLGSLAQTLKLSSSDLDELFILAAGIEA